MIDYLDIRFWTYDYYSPMNFWFLLVVPLLILYWFFESKSINIVRFPFPSLKTEKLTDWFTSTILPYLSRGLFLIAILFIILASAKPYRKADEEAFQQKFSEGIDIIIALDISTSMLARDFKPNRIEAAKQVAAEFIQNRPNDRIGLVVYEGEAFTKCPSTTDHSLLLESLMGVEAGVLQTNRTAIGMGLGLSVARLRSDDLKSKVIILMSDGVSNAGEIDPMTAAELAKAKGARVYTIGIGSKGTASMPVQTPFGIRYQQIPVDIDEETLTEVAQLTGGEYFRATDETDLLQIYQTIDQLEKTKVNVLEYKVDPPLKPIPFLLTALLLMLIGFIVSQTITKSII
jgi:Ca-activated chloride channel homolog